MTCIHPPLPPLSRISRTLPPQSTSLPNDPYPDLSRIPSPLNRIPWDGPKTHLPTHAILHSPIGYKPRFCLECPTDKGIVRAVLDNNQDTSYRDARHPMLIRGRLRPQTCSRAKSVACSSCLVAWCFSVALGGLTANSLVFSSPISLRTLVRLCTPLFGFTPS